jgi:hypothetical protein
MPNLTASGPVNAAIRAAQGLPSLIANLTMVDPALAQQLETKPLVASKTVWGTSLAGPISWASARYGLGWGADTSALVAGIVVTGASILFRLMTKQPIAGVLVTPAGTPPAADAMPPGVPPA